MPDLIFNIEPLDQEHDRGVFHCGVDFIDTYLAKRCIKDHARHKSRVYVAAEQDTNRVLGFYTLSLMSLRPEDSTPEEAQRKYGSWAIPLVYLGQIGVHEEFQKGRGIGSALMLHAFERTAEIANLAGTYGLALDAIDEERASWYEKRSFERYGSEKDGRVKMACPLTIIQKVLA